jgi:hypothetical protein
VENDLMAIERPTTKVSAETDLESLLDEAAKSPVLLEHRGILYQLSLDEDATSAKTNAEKEKELRVLDETIGSWADLDIDRIIHDIYEARRAGSRTPIDP